MSQAFSKNRAISYLLSFLFSVLFWLFRDIDAVIYSQNGYGVSDLSRYLHYYNNMTASMLLDIRYSDGPTYFTVGYLLKSIGLPFEGLVFLTVLLFYISFLRLSENLLGRQKWHTHALVFVILSYWIIPLATVALKQGIAVLTLLWLWKYMENGLIYKRIVLVFLVTSIHFSAIMLLPFALFKDTVNQRNWLLNGVLLCIIVLYIFDVGLLVKQTLTHFFDVIHIDIGALGSETKTYAVGFSILKATATLAPLALYRVAIMNNKSWGNQLNTIYIYYTYIVILGMILSGFPYHDRIFLYAWPLSSVFIVYSFVFFYKHMMQNRANTNNTTST